MNRQLVIRDEAEADLLEAAEWYEVRRKGLGVEFLAELRAKIARVREHPLQFPVVHRNGRRALLDRFPYAVYFIATDDLVEVVAVMHAKRHPRRWKGRF